MRLVCFGDSNTYGYDPRSFFGGRYPGRWTDLLAAETGWEVVNLGQNGREIPVGAGNLAGLLRQDDLLVVMVGSGPPRAPPPMGTGDWVPEERRLAEPAAQAGEYESLARRLGFGFADAGQWGVELAFDGVHFTEDGHRAFARGLQEAILCSLG